MCAFSRRGQMDMQTRLCSQAYQRPGQPLIERGKAGAQATLSLKGGLQALLQVVTSVSGRAVPYLPTRSASLPRHFCPRATHGSFILETKYRWGTAPRWALTGALRKLTNGKHKRTCNCQCLLWKLLRLFPSRWWAVPPCKCEHFHLGGV